VGAADGSLPERLTAAFSALDVNGDGVIDETEMVHVLSGLDSKLFTASAVRRMFRAADADADGIVHYAEFVTWLCNGATQDSGVAGKLLAAGQRKAQGSGKQLDTGQSKESAKTPANGDAIKPPPSPKPKENGDAIKPPPSPRPKEAIRRKPFRATSKDALVMNRYTMFTTDDAFMGEGTSSICRKGLDTQTQRTVAIKTYKSKKHGEKVALVKFKRQIEVLEELKRPFEKPDDPKLWSKELAAAAPEEVFMQLLDYSRDAQGQPGPDPTDGQMYVVTELAQYSLKDYMKTRKEEDKPMSKETVRSLARSIILVTAGLHAKGLVHLDLKPENLMIFDGVLKLIDVDGCIKIGTSISIDDESLSFSPVYCSPEWANFLIEEEEDDMGLTASPALDVWSIGMTLMELVTLDPVLKSQYASFFRHGREREEASFLFFDWLSSLQKPPLPRQIREHDVELTKLLEECLLVCDPNRRCSLAECLDHPFVAPHAALHRSKTCPIVERSENLPSESLRHRRNRVEDNSERFLLKGILWKLSNNGDPRDAAHWLQRDIWIANTGALCYFSLKDNKRLKLMDEGLLHEATVTKFDGCARDHAFQVVTPDQSLFFASESEDDCAKWIEACDRVKNDVIKTMHFGTDLAKGLRRYRLKVRNRRKAMDEKMMSSEGYKPRFKGLLWKLKADGDVNVEADWQQREMWLSKNGSFVYWSAKEERDLVYYTAPDTAHATVSAASETSSACPPDSWRFQVALTPAGDMELQPGEFAAASLELREAWLKEFARFRC